MDSVCEEREHFCLDHLFYLSIVLSWLNGKSQFPVDTGDLGVQVILV